MNYYLKLLKVKPGKEQEWRDWCNELNTTRRVEAKTSLKEENLLREGCYMFKRSDDIFVVGFMEWEGERYLGQDKITQEHFAKIKECLDSIDTGEELYLI